MTEGAIVHVVDQDTSVRNVLTLQLEAAGLAVRTYSSATQFLATPLSGMHGCILAEARMPDMHGLSMMQRLKGKHCHIPVVLMTEHGEIPFAVAALKVGVFDILEKPIDKEYMLNAVHAAVASNVHMSAHEIDEAEVIMRRDRLTPRERQVLQFVVAGVPNKLIAHNLGVSPRTIEQYRAHVMEKMAAHNLADLVRMTITITDAATNVV